jgi:hypothetical protein
MLFQRQNMKKFLEQMWLMLQIGKTYNSYVTFNNY